MLNGVIDSRQVRAQRAGSTSQHSGSRVRRTSQPDPEVAQLREEMRQVREEMRQLREMSMTRPAQVCNLVDACCCDVLLVLHFFLDA